MSRKRNPRVYSDIAAGFVIISAIFTRTECSGHFYDLPAYTADGIQISMEQFRNKVLLVTNSASSDHSATSVSALIYSIAEVSDIFKSFGAAFALISDWSCATGRISSGCGKCTIRTTLTA